MLCAPPGHPLVGGCTSLLQEHPYGPLGLSPSSQPVCHQHISFPLAQGLFVTTSQCLGFQRHQPVWGPCSHSPE